MFRRSQRQRGLDRRPPKNLHLPRSRTTRACRTRRPRTLQQNVDQAKQPLSLEARRTDQSEKVGHQIEIWPRLRQHPAQDHRKKVRPVESHTAAPGIHWTRVFQAWTQNSSDRRRVTPPGSQTLTSATDQKDKPERDAETTSVARKANPTSPSSKDEPAQEGRRPSAAKDPGSSKTSIDKLPRGASDKPWPKAPSAHGPPGRPERDVPGVDGQGTGEGKGPQRESEPHDSPSLKDRPERDAAQSERDRAKTQGAPSAGSPQEGSSSREPHSSRESIGQE